MQIDTTLTAVVPPKPMDVVPGAGDGTENTADLGASTEPKQDAKPDGKQDAKPDLTPPEEKAYITREKNKRKAVEQQLREQSELLNKALTALEAATKPKQAEAPVDRPLREQFDDPFAYEQALIEWGAAQGVKRASEETALQSARRRGETLVAAHKRRAEEARERYDDFDDVIATAGTVTKVLEGAILHSEMSAEVQYYLAANPKELAKLNEMDNAFDVARHIGRIETKLGEKPQGKEVTKAPAPIKPVGGTGGVPRNKNDPNITPEEFFAAVEAEHAAKIAALKSGPM